MSCRRVLRWDGGEIYCMKPDPCLDHVRMFYFGPWDQSGHYFFNEHGSSDHKIVDLIPWGYSVDGALQPGCEKDQNERWNHDRDPETEGLALVHHKDGWTAISFWDRTVDKRFASNSNYFAEGTFTFDQMVEMAKKRFAVRWNKMKFEVRLAQKAD